MVDLMLDGGGADNPLGGPKGVREGAECLIIRKLVGLSHATASNHIHGESSPKPLKKGSLEMACHTPWPRSNAWEKNKNNGVGGKKLNNRSRQERLILLK